MCDNRLLESFRSLISNRYGIAFPDNRLSSLDHKLGKIQWSLSINSRRDLLHRFEGNDQAIMDHIIHGLTVNHTYFGRENEHFGILAEDIRQRGIHTPRIWCAAASTGEEPYSIAIELHKAGITDYLLVASDIDREVLKKMKVGIYHESRLEYMDANDRRRFFTRNPGSMYTLHDDLRRNIRLKRLNLIDSIRFEGQFDYIFCRNVLIYFDTVTQLRVIRNLVANLGPEGLLFLGLTEGLNSAQCGVSPLSKSVYRR